MILNALKSLPFLVFVVLIPSLAHGTLLSFSNTNLITVTDGSQVPTSAVPYPSSIQVTGLNGQVIAKVTVTLHQLSHTFPSDLHMLLTGPQGQTVVLMSETGGQDKYSVTNLVITLDDNAAVPLPIMQGLQSGTFRPTTRHVPLEFSFPPPAPPAVTDYSYALSTFLSSDPNGIWNLFVVDYGAGDTGTVSGGWSLSLFVTTRLQIALSQTNAVVFWPASAQNCTLQSTTNLSPPVIWNNEPITPVHYMGQNFVTNGLTVGRKYYRLFQY
jgi:subtilisin-like proprotein convertase family protein